MDKESCPSLNLLKFFGRKWTLMILRVLKEEDNCRFKDIENELDGISPKTLSERLKEFQRLDIMEKKKFGEVPPRTEYTLTEKGKELIDCFRCMDSWAEKYDIEAEA